MANFYIEAKEKNNLKMIFHSLDDEKDGELEIKELVMQLKEKFDITVRLSEMELIIRHVDLDFDGKV